MDNPETLATLGTRHTNKQKTTQKTKTNNKHISDIMYAGYLREYIIENATRIYQSKSQTNDEK
jgi:hypothetical protein